MILNYDENLSSTVDYDQLCQDVTTFVESKNFALIENLANQVVELIRRQNPGAGQIRVKVAKPHAIKHTRSVSFALAR